MTDKDKIKMGSGTFGETEKSRDDLVKCLFISNIKTQEAFRIQSKFIGGLHERVSHLEHQLTNSSTVSSDLTSVEKSTFESRKSEQNCNNIEQDDSDVELISEHFHDDNAICLDSELDECLNERDACSSLGEMRYISVNNRYITEQSEASKTTIKSTANKKSDCILENAKQFESGELPCNLLAIRSMPMETLNPNDSLVKVPFISQGQRQKIIKARNNMSTQQFVHVDPVTSKCNEQLVNLSEQEEIKVTGSMENLQGCVAQGEQQVFVSKTEIEQHEFQEMVLVPNKVIDDKLFAESQINSEFHHCVVDCSQESNRNINGIWFGPGCPVQTSNDDDDVESCPSMFGSFAEDFQKYLKVSIQPMIDARNIKVQTNLVD